MSFRENLQHLRRTRNMTQEQLAMLVGVSRQSVTKWEAERAYPEMDKLMKLCDIFGCTLDDLVQGDLTGTEAAPSEWLGEGPVTDVCGYDAHMHRFARGIALGVTAIVLGTAGAALCSALFGEDSVVPALPVFGGVFLGVLFILPTALSHGAFRRAHPYIADFYTTADRQAGTSLFARLLVIGIGLIFLGLAGAVILGGNVGSGTQDNIAGVAILTGTALGAGLIVYGGILQRRFNLASYNDQDAGGEGDDLKPTGDSKRLADAISAIVMITATIIGLLLLFLGRGTAAETYFWLTWPIGGLICAIVNTFFAVRPMVK